MLPHPLGGTDEPTLRTWVDAATDTHRHAAHQTVSAALSVPLDLEGQGALVTGSGAGIGREIARWLARAGAAVVVHDVRAEKAEAVVAEIEAEGGQAYPIIADARDDAALEAMVTEAARLLGRLDVAVNNVGMYADQKPGPFVTLSGSHWRALDQPEPGHHRSGRSCSGARDDAAGPWPDRQRFVR